MDHQIKYEIAKEFFVGKMFGLFRIGVVVVELHRISFRQPLELRKRYVYEIFIR
jgi:hypothetical protein